MKITQGGPTFVRTTVARHSSLPEGFLVMRASVVLVSALLTAMLAGCTDEDGTPSGGAEGAAADGMTGGDDRPTPCTEIFEPGAPTDDVARRVEALPQTLGGYQCDAGNNVVAQFGPLSTTYCNEEKQIRWISEFGYGEIGGAWQAYDAAVPDQLSISCA